MEKFTSCLLRFSDGERPKIPLNPMSLEEVLMAKKNNLLLNQEEDPDELLADDESFDRHGIAQMEDVTDSADCTDKPGVAPTCGVNASDPVMTVPLKTKKAPDEKFGNLGLPENTYGKTQEEDIGSLSLDIPEFEHTNASLHYGDTKRGRRVSNVNIESNCNCSGHPRPCYHGGRRALHHQRAI